MVDFLFLRTAPVLSFADALMTNGNTTSRITGARSYSDGVGVVVSGGSGVFVYDSDEEKWYCIGRTAWATRDGRVSSGWKLPAGALPIDEIDFESEEEEKTLSGVRLAEE